MSVSEKKAADASYSSLEVATQRLYDERKDPSLRTVQLLVDMGIKGIYSRENSESGMFNSDFTMAVRRSREWLRLKAAEYVAENRAFPPGIDELLYDDPLTELAPRFKWRGMYKARNNTSQEDEDYAKFSTTWKNEKKEIFKSFVIEYRAKRKGKRLFKIGGLVAAGLAVVILTSWAAYEHYIKPDIKQEVSSSIPDIPTLDEMVARIKPEVREELERYNSQSAENIEKAIATTLMKYGEGSPFFDSMFPDLKERLEEEFKEDQQKNDERTE